MATKANKTRGRWLDELDVWSSPVMANMLWVVFVVPVITLPLAFVGLFAVMFHWMDSRRTQVFSLFFGTMRYTWRKCYLLFALDIAILAFLSFNLFVFQLMDMGDILAFLSRSATLFSLIVFVNFNVLAWVLVAIWDKPLKHILSVSLKLVFVQPLWSAGIALAFILPFAVSLVMPTVVFVVLTGSAAAYMACWGTYRLMLHYLSREDFALIELT